ncbi:MAG TPA: outer membrane beta-barrel protein [Bacteroidia bacterium]|nr:outer membrane beta-barrel protein [Bacteroidia bacterium]
MKKIVAIVFCLCAAQLAAAQDSLKVKKFFVGVFASPDLSYRTLSSSSGQTASWLIQARNGLEIPAVRYTTGLDFAYQLSKHFTLSLGVLYSSMGYNTKQEEFEFGPPNNTVAHGYSTYKYNYITVPIRADFYFTRKKIAPFVTLGASANFFVNEKSTQYITYNDGHTDTQSFSGNNSGLSKCNLQAQAGAGVDFTLGKSHIRIFPIFRMSFTPMNNKGILHEYLYLGGLGINYLFGVH